MTNYSKGIKLVIASAVILTVLLFFAPKNPWSSPEKSSQPGKIESKVELQPSQQKQLDSLTSVLNEAGDPAAKEKALNSIAAFWKGMKKPLQVAQTFEQ